MAEAFREITQWKDATPTGVYLLEGDKCFAFCNFKGEVTYFTKPMQIDKRGRKFEKVQNLFEARVVETDPTLVTVKGSKGETYYVDPVNKTCTCQGFTFRSKCKHVEAI
jgi:hypothetical protein